MTKHRWSKFFWQDHLGDDALTACSLAAQGLWVRMLCVMHKSEPQGHFVLNGEAPTTRQACRMLSVTEREFLKLTDELEAANVLSRDEKGIILSRRMLRDLASTEAGRNFGKTGGNPVLKGKPAEGGLTPPVKATPPLGVKLEAEAEAEAEERTTLTGGSAPRPAARPPRSSMGSRLPPDWLPVEPGYAGATHATLERFRDYWTAQAGARGRMVDWDATWRNWCRRDAENRTTRPGAKTSAMSTTAQNDELMRLVAEPTPLLRMAQ